MALAVLTVVLAVVPFAVHLERRLDFDITGTYFVSDQTYESLGFERFYARGRFLTGFGAEILLRDGPYDGQYFLLLANDPLAKTMLETEQGRNSRFYRARRIAWSWLAWAIGAGRSDLVPWTLAMVQILTLGVAAWAVARVAVDRGTSPAWVLLFGPSLGTMVCLTRGVSDGFATSVLLVACAAWHFRRYATGAALFAVAVLAKEYLMLVPAVLGAVSVASGWAPLARVTGKFAPRAARENAAPLPAALSLCVVPAALAGWCGYLAATGPGLAIGNSNTGLPFVGILAWIGASHPTNWEVIAGYATLLSLPVVILAAARWFDGFRLGAVALVALAVVTNEEVWIEAWAYGRVHMTIPAMLLFTGVRGRRLDLVAPAAFALAGVVVWSRHVG